MKKSNKLNDLHEAARVYHTVNCISPKTSPVKGL